MLHKWDVREVLTRWFVGKELAKGNKYPYLWSRLLIYDSAQWGVRLSMNRECERNSILLSSPQAHTLLDSHPDWQKGNNSRHHHLPDESFCNKYTQTSLCFAVRTWLRRYKRVFYTTTQGWNIHFWQARTQPIFPLSARDFKATALALSGRTQIAWFGCFGRAGVTFDLSVTRLCILEWKLYHVYSWLPCYIIWMWNTLGMGIPAR